MVNLASGQLPLVENHHTNYSIVLAKTASASEVHAAEVLSKYLDEISGADFNILTDDQPIGDFEISIGNTNRIKTPVALKPDAFIIKNSGKHLDIYGAGEKGTLYAVYHFLENYLGCRKYSASFTLVPKKESVNIQNIDIREEPQFQFRQVYYPDQYSQEYRDWHKLHVLEEKWGLWGHSFDVLVPARDYFKTHPEYYALVNGERKSTQLCLSNPEVLKILVQNLRKKISEDPEKQYWSVSQNDGLGYCTCDACAATDRKFGGPQGSLIQFVNKVAAEFPDKTISTLAYLYSKHPPQNLKPAENASIMLSTIDVDRAKPIESNPKSAGFRNDLQGWHQLTKQLMIWDYVVQFTNYISPFPNLQTLNSNVNYFAKMGVNGMFTQGTENTPGEFSALKSYLLAKLTWQPTASASQISDQFITDYFGKAAPYIVQYQKALQTALQNSNRLLDIYGEPTTEWNTWLTPEQIDGYSEILDQAEKSVQNEPEVLPRVQTERLALEFAVLQQARFFGIEKHGIFIVKDGNWKIKPGFEQKVNRFLFAAQHAGIKQLNEEGLTLSQYQKEWERIFSECPLLHLATGKTIKALTKYSTDYPAKLEKTLTDGTRGYNNFQYNYLGWLGDDMEISIDLGKTTEVKKLKIGFLEDQRHWAFLPTDIIVEGASDSLSYSPIKSIKLPGVYETYDKNTERVQIEFPLQKVRYLKIKAKNLKKLPEWRDFPNRKPWIFCDEIEVY